MFFPSIQNPSYGMRITREDNVIRSTAENGIVITRRKYTKTRKTFELSFNSLSLADRNTLTAFYENNASLSFEWINPADNITYTVRFKEPIEETYNNFNQYDINLKLEEI